MELFDFYKKCDKIIYMEQNSINFLRDSLIHHHDVRNSLDRKASFVLAIAGVVFAFSIVQLEKVQYFIIAVTSFITIILSVLILCLPYRGKIKGKFGLMCWWGFSGKSFEQYSDELNKVFVSDERIIEEYKKEIWNLANHSLKPKSELLKWASYILVVGLFVGFVLFFV